MTDPGDGRAPRTPLTGGAGRWLVAVAAVSCVWPAVAVAAGVHDAGVDTQAAASGSPKAQPSSVDERKDGADRTDEHASGDDKIGKPPADDEDVHSLFLRHMSLLLVRREMEVDVGLSYMYGRSYDPTQNLLTYSRYAQLSLAFSFGLASFIQAAVSAPLVLQEEHTFQYANAQEQASRGVRPGNIVAAVNIQIVRATAVVPDVMLFSDVAIPLGSESPNTANPNGVVHAGLWSFDMGVAVVKTSDPVSIVAGLSYGHAFAETIAGRRTELGDYWGYMAGVGFAANSKVSLTVNFRGAWQAPTRQGGERLVDTEAEPMSLGMGLIYAVARSWYVSPAVVFPINADGGNVVLTVPCAHRF